MSDRGATSGTESMGQDSSAATSLSMYNRAGTAREPGDRDDLRASSSTDLSPSGDGPSGSLSSPGTLAPSARPGDPSGGPARGPRPMSFLDLLRMLPEEDQRGVMRIEKQGRIAGLFSGAATGTWVYRALKRRGSPLPLAGACLLGVTLGYPLGLSLTMAYNSAYLRKISRDMMEIQQRVEEHMTRGGLARIGPNAPPLSSGYPPWLSSSREGIFSDKGSIPGSYPYPSQPPSSQYLFPSGSNRGGASLDARREGSGDGKSSFPWRDSSLSPSSAPQTAEDESFSTFLQEDANSWDTGDHQQQRDMTSPSSTSQAGGETLKSDEILKE